jgi:hypothetical protein
VGTRVTTDPPAPLHVYLAGKVRDGDLKAWHSRGAPGRVGSRRVELEAVLGVDLELWTRDEGDISTLLPRAEEWGSFDGELQFDGEGWLLSVFAPEPVETSEVPAELAGLVDGLAFRVELGVEPSDAPPEAWTLLQQVMASIGGWPWRGRTRS